MKTSLRSMLGGIVVAAALMAANQACTQEPDVLPNNQPFMRAKLVHAQKVLEGLALRDLNSVADHAQKLSLLSLESNWQVYQTIEYQQLSQEFRRTADSMSDAAKAGDADRAAMAYVDMTLKCFSCHRHVRDTQGQSSTELKKLIPK